jgi:hypothetical protein
MKSGLYKITKNNINNNDKLKMLSNIYSKDNKESNRN